MSQLRFEPTNVHFSGIIKIIYIYRKYVKSKYTSEITKAF